MFTAKQPQLFKITKKEKTSATTNGFLVAAGQRSAKTRSENGAIKFATTGSDFVDQFGKLGEMKAERNFETISKDMSVLYAKDPETAIKFALYIRMITRKIQFSDGTTTENVQRGAGLKHEAIMRMIWLHIHHKDQFYANIDLIVAVGSWRDIFEMLRYDLQYNGWNDRKLDWDKMGEFILAGITNDQTSQLILKYIPQIKAKSKCTTLETQANTLIGKWLCNLIFGKDAYRDYRLMKSSGKAHTWQQLISKKMLNKIEFDTVHGRALALLIGSKFLKNHGLEAKYEAWIAKKPVAKFTGFVHELFAKMPSQKYQIDTLNAQFMKLVETAKTGAETATGMIVVRDTSGSMSSPATGTKQSCYDIAKALGLFFSYMLPDGAFGKHWIEFNRDAKLHEWKGSTPYERWQNDHSGIVGNTDFQSVIQLLCRMKEAGVKESEFPNGILCISDSEFDPGALGKTNVQTALEALRRTGFSNDYVNNFKIVLWNLQRYGAGNKFETHGDVKNVFYFSGYDASTVAFLTGVNGKEAPAPSTALELFNAAMDQEVLDLVTI